MEILGVIPARGGSKGVPGKNIKPLLGKPLIAWTIDEAKKSKLLTRTIVSTDDSEIAEIARSYSAEVPFLRPAEISQDLSTSVEVLRHALDWLKEHEGYEPDIMVLLPPTAPLLQAKDIDRAIGLLIESPDADSVRPVIESSKHPYKTLRLEGEYVKAFFPKEVSGFDEPFDLPRQLFPKAYVYSGAMQVMWRRTLRELNSLTGGKSKYFLMRPEDSINIDTALDFKLAEILLTQRLKNEI
jgi:CMP-N-acetylneuraminic acid synthetase